MKLCIFYEIYILVNIGVSVATKKQQNDGGKYVQVFIFDPICMLTLVQLHLSVSCFQGCVCLLGCLRVFCHCAKLPLKPETEQI